MFNKLTYLINFTIGITSYKLAQFTTKYLQKHWSDTKASTDIDTLKQLEQSILDRGVIQSDENINQKSGIQSRTAQRWLHHLDYNWKNVWKGVFYDEDERPDVIEYDNKFLSDMDALKLYLVEFEEDGSIKPKSYPKDCTVGGPDWRPVILITHDESTFNANDSCR